MTLQQLKAMKLALSTLREVQSETFRLLRNGQRLYAEEKVWNTIIEIKQALADHAMQEVQRLGQEIEQEPKIGCVNHDCDQCKAQPEQEPVAFASHGVINWIADKQFQHEADLYTTPPQQTWVGLNDDEIDYLIHLAYTGDEEFVQTIEAKLKEKNLPCIKPKWIGLTEKEHTDIAVECGCMSADWVFYGAAVERKLKERNT